MKTVEQFYDEIINILNIAENKLSESDYFELIEKLGDNIAIEYWNKGKNSD